MLAKTALWIIDHLQYYGGAIVVNTEGQWYSWGRLMKDENIKWYSRDLTENTLNALMPYLRVLDNDPLMGTIEYELNPTGQNLDAKKEL